LALSIGPTSRLDWVQADRQALSKKVTKMQRRQQVDTEKPTATEALLQNTQAERDRANKELKKAQTRTRELEEEMKKLRAAAETGATSGQPAD